MPWSAREESWTRNLSEEETKAKQKACPVESAFLPNDSPPPRGAHSAPYKIHADSLTVVRYRIVKIYE